MKKVIAISLLLILVGAFVFAGGQSEAGADSAKESYKIGTNNFGRGAYPLDITEKSVQYSADAYGNELVVADDQFKIDKIPTDIQNLISSGVDGIVFLGMVETLFPVVSKMSKSAKVALALIDKYPTEQAAIDQLQDNPYFVGIVGSDNKLAGYVMGEYAASLGLKKAVVFGAAQGDPTHDPRKAGFKEAFEAGGGKVLSIINTEDPSQAAKPAEDLLVAYPEADCLYASGGDFATATIFALEKHPEMSALTVFCTDLDPILVEKLKNGKIAAANGGHFIAGAIGGALLQNFLDGHPILDKDGKKPVFKELPVVVLPASQAAMYEKFWIQDFPLSDEELKNLSYRNNPAVSYEDFAELISNYSINERIQKKYEEGLITEAEFNKYYISE